MPPRKRKNDAMVEQTKAGGGAASSKATSKKARGGQSKEPVTGGDGWTVHPPSLIYKAGSIKHGSKLACFDLDGTLVRTKSSSQFARNADDWKFFNKKVPNMLKQFKKDGYKLVIFSNQGQIKSALEGKGAQNKKKLIDNMMQQAGVEMQVFLATGKDDFRKPEIGMWDFMSKNCNGGLEADKQESFFVGDAAGRDSDFSDSDKIFAEKIGIKFKVPEDVFGEGEGKKQNNSVGPASDGDNKNEELTVVFTDLANAFAGDRFKSAAYRKVATILGGLKFKVTLDNLKEVGKLQGIGKASLEKIQEFLKTGKIEQLEDARGGGGSKQASKPAKDTSMAMKFM